MTSKDINNDVESSRDASKAEARRAGLPKENSNFGHDRAAHERSNISDTISGGSPKSHADHVDDGFPDDRQPKDGEHTDDAKDGEQGSADTADQQATKFKRSI